MFHRLQGHEELFVKGLLDSKVRAEIVNGLTPSVLLVRCKWKLIAFFGLAFHLHVKVSVPFGLRVVVILVLFHLF